jgi:transcriptional regulator with XRE-family HTH domain
MGPPTLSPQQVRRVVDLLRVLHEQCNCNATELARRLKLSQTAVSELLAGKNKPSFRTTERIAALAGVQVWSLLGSSSVPTPASHPTLMATLEFLGDRVTPEARERVLAAAMNLPDLAQATWIQVLMDPAHHSAPQSHPRSGTQPIGSAERERERTLPSRETPSRTGEITLVRKKDQ